MYQAARRVQCPADGEVQEEGAMRNIPLQATSRGPEGSDVTTAVFDPSTVNALA
jgi:hypothetical protein